MKRLLIVSPHFPPTDAVDMHRVRMNVAHYPDGGWEPTVLCVRAEDAGRTVDDRLSAALPEGLDVRRVAAVPERVTRPLGLSALGLRAHRALAQAGDALLSQRKYDLVFFSTTAFPAMTLGDRWRRRFGVPYVLDFQDPWHAAPPSVPRRAGLKHDAMRALHRRLEGRAAPNAGGLIAVSDSYIGVLKESYDALRRVPSAVIPFGFAARDFDAAARSGARSPLAGSRGGLACVGAGCIAPAMLSSVETLFETVRRALSLGVDGDAVARLAISLIGTGYRASGNAEMAKPVARKLGLEDRVAEHPDRVPMLDAYRALIEADVLLILGSDDPAYQPSKLYPYLFLDKPVICVASRASRLAGLARGVEGVIFVATDAPVTDATARHFAAELEEIAGPSVPRDYPSRKTLTSRFEASRLARQECALFDEVVHARAA
jgi:hypothetical protein